VAAYNGDWKKSTIGATRKWSHFPKGKSIIQVSGNYPPSAPPAAAIADIIGNNNLETVVSLNDGSMYCFDAQGTELWSYDFKNGLEVVYSTEAIIADLNKDGSPEIIFSTFGSPDVSSAYLIVLAANGEEMVNLKLTENGTNGNGDGVPAAPTVADLDGDGHLEVFLQSFNFGLDVYSFHGSADDCVQWATGRGGYQRRGGPDV